MLESEKVELLVDSKVVLLALTMVDMMAELKASQLEYQTVETTVDSKEYHSVVVMVHM